MLPSRSGRSLKAGASAALLLAGSLHLRAVAAEKESSPRSGETRAKSSAVSKGVPLPIGQEAKGLVLPDFDLEGRLRARFEAGTAKRIDAEHIHFTGLKMTTFTKENTADLQLNLPEATLDLNTRVVTSAQRTTVARADFNISGDTVRFDTVERKGTLSGNVKMVITGQSPLAGSTRE